MELEIDIEEVTYNAVKDRYHEVSGYYVGEEGDHTWNIRLVAEVCHGCQGRGQHVNRSIDGNGLPDHYREDPEFMDSYFNGDYDVSCGTCDGQRVVFTTDWEDLESTNPALAKAFRDHEDREAQYAWEDECERRAGA